MTHLATEHTAAMVRRRGNDGPQPHTFLARLPSLLVANRTILNVCAGSLLAIYPATGMSAEWRFQPRVAITETYTDNVDLLPQAQSDFISQISPGFSLDARSKRWNVLADYTLQNLFYARDSSRNAHNNLLSATGKAEILPDWFFLDALASISRQNNLAQAPQNEGFVTGNNNTTQTRTYTVSPYVRDRVGTFLGYELRYQRDHVTTDSTSLPSSDGNQIKAQIRSGPEFSRVGWGLDYNRQDIDYNGGQQRTRIENTVASGRYLISARFALLASAGYEKNDFPVVGPKPEGTLWSAGFAWQPSKLTNVTATAGERFFGRTYALDTTHRTRALFWSAQYSENINSSRSQFLSSPSANTATYLDALASASMPDPLERARFVNNFIVNNGLPTTIFAPTTFFTDRNFLEKRLTGSVTYNTPKTTSILSLFRVKYDADAIGAIATGPLIDDTANSQQTGGSLLVNWRFASRTGFDFSIGTDKTHFRTIDRDDTLKYVRLGLRHQLQPKITGSIDCRRAKRDSNDPSVAYTENAISAGVNIRF